MPLLRRWPSFVRFTRLVPNAFQVLSKQDRVPLHAALGVSDAAIEPIRQELVLEIYAGTAASPNVESMTVEISIEDGTRSTGSTFLMLIRDRRVHEEIKVLESIRAVRRA